MGGAFGSAGLNSIINGKLTSHYAPTVSNAATEAGLSTSSVPALLESLASVARFADIPGINPAILAAATGASANAYAATYRLAWASIISFVVLALVAIWFLKGVKELMTEHVEATVEKDEVVEKNAVRWSDSGVIEDRKVNYVDVECQIGGVTGNLNC